MANIIFSPAQMWLLFEGGSYSRAALIILDNMGTCEMDMKSMIVLLAGDKHTLWMQLTQYEPSDIHCLRLFVVWPALHAK